MCIYTILYMCKYTILYMSNTTVYVCEYVEGVDDVLRGMSNTTVYILYE